MSIEPKDRHPGEGALQGLLDGSLPEGEAERVRGHVSSCARCSAEMEAWELLFHGLADLEDIGPSADFVDRVMTSLPREPETRPLGARVREWLGVGRPGVEWVDHLNAARAQDLLDGALPRRELAAVEQHLHGCRLCREEVDGWRSLMMQLDGVPTLAPSPIFGERVMAHVRVRNAVATARPTVGERLRAWAGEFAVRNRRRMAALAGAAVTPAVTMALVAYVVFSHPLVTIGNLISFFWLKGQEAISASASALLGEVLQSGVVVMTIDVTRGLIATPSMALTLFALFGIGTLTAFWILYRNLIATHSVDGPYAHPSI